MRSTFAVVVALCLLAGVGLPAEAHGCAAGTAGAPAEAPTREHPSQHAHHGGGLRFAVEALFPLYQDLNGPQLETDFVIIAGTQWASL